MSDKRIKTSLDKPERIVSKEYEYCSFANGEVFEEKQVGRLPMMGWNSWNAFGSNNTEELTRKMADRIVELGLDKLGYKYVVLDDGCYAGERVNGRLCSNPETFPSGFGAMGDYIHQKGLKFGMYNDIGVRLCSGLEVGTCGHEDIDAEDYVNWNIDFVKVDNCYYLWDNATFSNPENAQYVYAPRIKSIQVQAAETPGSVIRLDACTEGIVTGSGASISDEGYVSGIGTLDGTGIENSPLGKLSSELVFKVDVPAAGNYTVTIEYAS